VPHGKRSPVDSSAGRGDATGERSAFLWTRSVDFCGELHLAVLWDGEAKNNNLVAVDAFV
jgi:hypothetical protein